MTAQPTEYESREDFYDAADFPEYAIRDGEYMWWLTFSTEDGDWFGVRAFSESDDERDPNSLDRWRPVGPVPLDRLPTPWRAVPLDGLTFASSDVRSARG